MADEAVGVEKFLRRVHYQDIRGARIFHARIRSAEVTVVILRVGVSFHFMVRGCDAVPGVVPSSIVAHVIFWGIKLYPQALDTGNHVHVLILRMLEK
jgi:hypothetical protein